MCKLKDEYLMLRDEILHLSEMENNIINIFYTSVTAILAFALSQSDTIFLLLPYVVIIPSYLMFISKSEAIYKIATYLYEFHECEDMFFWEHRNREFAKKKNHALLNDVSYNLPFLFVNILTLVLFLLKFNLRSTAYIYEWTKFFIAVFLFGCTIYLVRKKGKVDIGYYRDVWKEIKEENKT